MKESIWGKLTDREVIFLNAIRVTMGRLELGVATPQELTDFLKYSVDEAKTAKASWSYPATPAIYTEEEPNE